jgi:cytoskeletal protein CcmA (bactofilin family)
MEEMLEDSIKNGNLTVGEGVALNGTFVVPGTASIAGKVDGELTASEIIVSSSGVIKGKVSADVIDLRGEMHENITAKKSLFIRSTGKLLGTVQYAEIEIEKGGDLQGTLQKIDANFTPSSSKNPFSSI